MPGREAHTWEAADVHIRELFAKADADKDGKINADELKGLLSEISGDSTTMEDVEMLMKRMGLDHEGHITQTEFVAAMLNSSEDWLEGVALEHGAPANGEAGEAESEWAAADEMIRAAFKEFDTDKDGRISASEIKSLLGKLTGDPEHSTDEDVALLIKQIDQDHDGLVTESEFVNKMLSSSEDWLSMVSLA
ncbi:hypothetical protein DFJ74DRAFT_696285 [Hyaloraphidium curvatum]|nr:hypothetical protein DFJ74DRAFT_696285 [Hyaloraphidium curvatum]